ncbi:MAG: hypothetical protein ACI9LG_003507, partial [Moritella dasanensis]
VIHLVDSHLKVITHGIEIKANQVVTLAIVDKIATQ